MPSSEIYYEILSIMDRALIRGAAHFSEADSARLRTEKERWVERGESAASTAIIDKFLSTTMVARGASQGETARLDLEVLDLKSAWRSAFKPS